MKRGKVRCQFFQGNSPCYVAALCGINYYKGFPIEVKQFPNKVEPRERLNFASSDLISTFSDQLRRTAGKRSGQRNYKRSLMQARPADPDERRTWGTHSLAEHTKGVSVMYSVTPHAGPTFCTSTLASHGGGNEIEIYFIQTGSRNASPRCSTAQHIRAFLAAMATTARQ